jgi:S-disulfanyl-L-cysteine oxidoreductase SoxD
MMRATIFSFICLALTATAAAEEGSVWDGVYSEEQTVAGAKLFAEQCLSCHSNTSGQVGGHGPSPSIIGEDFVFRWVDSSVADFYDVIRQTMPQAAPNSLDAQQYADITAYVLKLNNYPAGESPLRIEDYVALQSVWIEAAQ